MLRSLMTVSGFTLMSRILGFLRDILIARFVGTGMVADAFFAAFRFPNLFRRIFGEGAFNSAFVPLFGKRVAQDGRMSAINFANNAFSVLFLVLGILTILLIPVMAFVMLAVVPGFLSKVDTSLSGTPQDFEVTLRGARAVYFQAAEGEKVTFHDLNLTERGDPEVGKVMGEIFGGDTQAVGETVPVISVLNLALEREGEVDEDAGETSAEVRARLYDEEKWMFKDGLLRIPLPKGHDFAVVSGKVSGAGEFKVFRNDPSAYDFTVKLSKITFIYLLCMALVAHLSGVLTTLKKFAAPAFSPVLLNLVFLVGLLAVVRFTDSKGEVLAWCVAVAGFLQLGVLWMVCRRAGLPIALRKPVFDSGMKRLFILMGPGVIAAGIQQINLLVSGVIASFQQGAISYLYYSDRVYQLPLGMIGIAFGMVLLPEITRLVKTGDESKASSTMISGIELAMIVTVPAAIALMVIPVEVVSLLFERKNFTAEDSLQTGRALAAFAIGLPGYVLIKVLQPGYFAREDTKSPMKMAGVTVLVNIVMSLALFPFYGHVGLAFATSVAAWVNVALLWFGLRGFVNFQGENWKRLLGMVIASSVMALALVFAKPLLAPWLGDIFWQKAIAMTLLMALGVVVYALAVLKLKVTSISELKAAFRS
ncbi:murein biosynthesis integral membrane protein MurJ [Akkermansiaceae bacterium]|nr:murein biosynthesis integral membrane protein MurJ [Akkermansiaceae bacterium]MDB4578976.1 murein biosynthesis integral membrane protein MurJ [Akkermansiaceae bacterium]